MKRAADMTATDVLAELENAIARFGTTKAFAAKHDLSPQYVTDVLKGRRAPADSICYALGLDRIVVYRRRP
jgi:predicted metallopeptidase